MGAVWLAFTLAPVAGRTADPIDPLGDVVAAVFLGPTTYSPGCATESRNVIADSLVRQMGERMFSH
jgi:hypothetical protein